jgi:hypothetical protein
MPQEHDNSGSLFKNDRKEKPNHADYTGNATIDGVDYWMNAWIKEGKNGRKFMSFSFRPKNASSSRSSSGSKEAADFF